MIRTGVESALIIEDWDVRIVEQMQQFAIATKVFLGKKEITLPKNLATVHMLDSY